MLAIQLAVSNTGPAAMMWQQLSRGVKLLGVVVSPLLLQLRWRCQLDEQRAAPTLQLHTSASTAVLLMQLIQCAVAHDLEALLPMAALFI